MNPQVEAFLKKLAMMAPPEGVLCAMTMTMAIGAEAKRLLGELPAAQYESLILQQQQEIDSLRSQIFTRDLSAFVANGGVNGLNKSA